MQKTSKKECGTALDVDETDLGRPNTHQASPGIVSDVPQSANRKKKASRSLNRGWKQQGEEDKITQCRCNQIFELLQHREGGVVYTRT